MKLNDLQLRRALSAALFVLLLSVIGMTRMYAYDFSAVCETGQTLYYNIIDAENHYVELTCPGTVDHNGWLGFTKPTGDIILSESVQYNGITYVVTSISEYAFYSCSGMTGSLTIPNSVTEIGGDAFRSCTGFTGNLTISNSVTTIGESAFIYCDGFTGNLFISNSVTSIGDWAFWYCNNWETIVVETGNTIYDSRDNCNALIKTSTNELVLGCKNTIIPNSVSIIGDGAFANCSGLTGDLIIPNSVTTIGEGAFAFCSGLTGNLTIPNSVTTLGFSAFQCCIGFTGNLIIGNSVTEIGDYAFAFCSGFTGTLTISNSVTKIDSCAFAQCSGFTGDLIIPNSVTEIGGYAFKNCTGFTGHLTIGNSVTTISERAFESCRGFTGLTIGNSVTEIRKYAFNSCSGFTGVNYTGSIDQWCNISFGNASSTPLFYAHNLYLNDVLVTDLVIPENVTEIKAYTFSGATCLTSLTIPNSVTTIGNRAFLGCSSLTGNLTIPNSVTSIGDYAFLGCSGFDSINSLAETPPSVGSDAFYNVNHSIPVTVPCGMMGTYQSASGWSEFTNYIEDCSLHITATTNPAEGGTIIGAGTFDEGNTCTLVATPNEGYDFENWTNEGNIVSNNTTYSFTVTEDASYVANFTSLINPDENNIVYVKPNGCGLNDGSSWDNATSNLNLALEYSGLQIDKPTIWVAAGVYYGDITGVNAFTMIDGVSVYGGFAGNEPPDYDLSLRNFDTNATILDGQNERRVLVQSSEFIMETTWDGFTIRNGRTPSAGPQPANCGGGALIRNGNLRHCHLENNYSATDGGGVYAYSSAEIRDCKVVNNYANIFGGGIYVVINNPVVISNCLVANNTASSGGAGICSWFNNTSMNVVNI